MREINKIAESLFEKVRDRFEDVSLGDENAKATSNPEDARFFNFDYSHNGKNFGNVTLSLIDEMSLKVYFSKNISQGLDDEERKQWYSFLRELREFARRNMLSFEPRDITRKTLKHRDLAQVSKADGTYSKDEVVVESRLHGTSRSSYQECGPARIIVRHVDRIDPERRGERSRHIRSIYIENSEGERFKLPSNNLRYARAMARHVSEGGMINDEFGKYITEIADACAKLRPFKNSMRRRTFEDDETKTMVEAASEYHGLLNTTLKRLGGRKGYHACKESWHADATAVDTDVDLDSLRERFVKRVYNDQMDQALPLVKKAYEMKKHNKFSQYFESWANQIVDEDLEPDYNNILELLAEELPVGADAINATASLEATLIVDNENYQELVSQLEELATQDPNADAREIIMAWMESYMPRELEQITSEMPEDEELAEGGFNDDGSYNTTDDESVADEEDAYEYDEDQVEMIQSAIIRRILGNVKQHSELIMKAGPEGVMNAALDVASFHAPVEELGTSDISNMVRQVYREVGVEYPEVSEEYKPREEKPLTYKKEAPSSKRKREKYYDYLAKTLGEGRMKDVALDIEELSNKQFYAKYKKSKEEMKATLAEAQGDDYVNRDEKLKRAGAKPLGMMDKLKNIPRGMKAMAKGETEDDLALYNKSKATNESEITVSEMKRLAGL